ncbi:uncharacterized protein LOC113274854 isoform X4 [Papaver somniferum]|uniref:uncharacterized protein LOC113274854 isoform X4 n=1 Tax=Papaver somniferum TaxID=3469 RepID=UPI000E6FA4F2|nr:uncharacterized protein LOC113274854 isoform X4 [Papaver somniferum]
MSFVAERHSSEKIENSYEKQRMGRDLVYDPWSWDLLCAASSSELYRINLEQEVTAPQFLDKMAVGTSDGKVHQMAVGTSDGKVLVYDLGSSHPTRVEDHMRVILW